MSNSIVESLLQNSANLNVNYLNLKLLIFILPFNYMHLLTFYLSCIVFVAFIAQ